MDKNLSNSKPRDRGRPKKTSKIIEQPSSPHISDSDGEMHRQPSKPSTRRLTVEIPSRQKAPAPKKRSNPKDSDQDGEESSGAEQNGAKRRKKDQFGQDNSKDYSPLEGDNESSDDSSDDLFIDEPKGNKSKIKGKGKGRGRGKTTRSPLEEPEKVPGEDEDVVFDDLWTLDDESNLLMSWSEDDQTLLDSLPKTEIALWRRSMRLFSVGPEELFPPNVTISRADLPHYVGKDGREILNTIHLTAKFCDTFKYIITLPFLAKRRGSIQYLLTKALRLRCGDRCTVPKSFESKFIDMETTELLETLRHAGIIGKLTCGQERIFKDSLGDRFPQHFPQHFHFHEHLKDIVQPNSGMKPRKISKNSCANEDTYQLRTRDLKNIIKAWDSYRNNRENSHHRLSSMKEYFDENKILKNRKGEASLDQVKLWKKNWVLSQRRRQLRLEKQSNLSDPLGDEIFEDNNLSDDAEESGYDLGHGSKISSDEENQEDDQVMIDEEPLDDQVVADDEPFGMDVVSGDKSPVPTGPQEGQRIEPFEVITSPKGQNLPDVPFLPEVPPPDRSIEVRCKPISEASDSENIPGLRDVTLIQRIIAKCDIQQYRHDEDYTLVQQSNRPMIINSEGKIGRAIVTELKMLRSQAYAYLVRINLAKMNALYADADAGYVYKYPQPIICNDHSGSVMRPQRAIEALEFRSLSRKDGENVEGEEDVEG